ncbi:MAG: gluconate 2-dehydrogenase subunit 3 family protein [Alsobacter sp.]
MTHHHDHDHSHGDHHPGGRAPGLSRRAFLRRSSEMTFAAAVTITSAGALLNTAEAWGMDVTTLKPETMRTLILVARDIYPHDKVPDRFYAIAVKPYDEKSKDEAFRSMIEGGIAALDAQAGKGGYVAVPWEAQRVALLRQIDTTPFFNTVRSGLVVSLYNQKEVWPIFGYEGESYSKGGYINRGFNDIDWL